MPFDRTMTFSLDLRSSASSGGAVSLVSGLAEASSMVITQQPARGTLGLQEDAAFALQDLERGRPELQPQDVAFPREQVVVDSQPPHGPKMAADDRGRR